MNETKTTLKARLADGTQLRRLNDGFFYVKKGSTWKMVIISFKRDQQMLICTGLSSSCYHPMIYFDGTEVTHLDTIEEFLHHVTRREEKFTKAKVECTCSLPMANQMGHEYSGYTCPSCRD